MTSNMASQSRFIFRIYSQLVGEADVRTKDASLIDGTVEHTALVYLTKDGEIGCFNSYSDKEDADEINTAIAQTIGAYTNIPVVVAEEGKCLKATTLGKSYRFMTDALKTDVMAHIKSVLIGVAVVFIALAVMIFLIIRFA